MSDLVYLTPKPPARLFKPGDTVEVLDLKHKVMSVRKVTRVRGNRVWTDCGRQWNQYGWWVGEDNVWPFPSIRHKREK